MDEVEKYPLKITEVCITAISNALRYINEHKFVSPYTDYKKQSDNIASDIDIKLQSLILEALLLESSEGFVFYSEELEKPKIFSNPNYKLILDPLDQTSSFIYGNLEFASTSILILDMENNPMGAVVGDICHQKIYYADKNGAWYGRKKIKPSEKTDLLEARIAVYAEKQSREYLYEEIIFPLMERSARVVNNGGSLFACRVADGRFHAALEPKPVGLYEFAGAYIAEMAGCVVTDIEGNKIDYDPEQKSTYIVSSNLDIHRQILKSIKK
jgi:myo-inositol-1(or 4)-monophosphatase